MRDVTIDDFSQDDGNGNLESELVSLRAQLREAERDGAEIAMRAEKTERKLRDELAQNWKHCVGCEIKRRILALIGAIPIGALWFCIAPWDDSDPVQNLLGVLVTLTPLLIVYGLWHWTKFKER